MLHGNEPLSEIQKYLNEVYGSANHELSVESILARMLETISETSSPFAFGDAHATFVKALSWYLAFCNKISIDVQTCVIKRYPHVCPACISEVCICERTSRLPARASYLAGDRRDELRSRAENILNKQKISRKKTQSFDLDWFARNLSDIYPVNRARWRVNRFYFPSKLLRESGKLANGFRKYRNAGGSAIDEGTKKLLEDDAADFFAWLIGYWSLAADELNDRNLQLEVFERYKSGCPYCHQVPCRCPREKRLGNRAEFVSFNLLNQSPDLARELERRLVEVRKSLDPYPELVKEYGSKLEQETATKSDPRGILSKIADSANKLDEISGHAVKIGQKISSVYELLERGISFLQG